MDYRHLPDYEKTRTFTIASRASNLAQIQTNLVVDALKSIHFDLGSDAKGPKFQTSFMTNEAGDVNKTTALYMIGGKALWTKELEVALKENAVDMLVHSLKDVPTELPEGCVIAGVPAREDPVDSLIVKKGLSYKSLDDFPPGSVVGTGSIRRVALLQRNYPHLTFLNLRGNIDTRVSKLDAEDSPFAGIILAKAGLVRAGVQGRITQDLHPPILYHAVSQGALGIEVRSDDKVAVALCEYISDWKSKWCCFAERACLNVLEGGCSVPVGVASGITEGGKEGVAQLRLTGTVTSLDGQKHVEDTLHEEVKSLADAEEVGRKLARRLIEIGAGEILDEINEDRAGKIAAEATKNQKATENINVAETAPGAA